MLTWQPSVRRPLSATLRDERPRVERSAVLLVLGLLSVLGAGLADLHVHRGLGTAASAFRLQPVGREQGTNIDLRRYAAADLDGVMAVLAGARLTHVRQTFSWRDIEPTQGAFDWSRYDPIVSATARAGVGLVVTLADTPDWARAPEARDAPDAPPRATAAFAAFCAALRQRYPDLRLFQVGPALDDPGLWGGAAPDPDLYAALLSVAAESLRVSATASVLISADVGTPAARATGADLAAIRGVLGAPRVAQWVDVVALVADGGEATPYDRRVDPGRRNLSRTVLLREALLDLDGLGYADRPVWLTRFGWTDPGEGVTPPERSAELVAAGLRRVRTEWPWVDLVLNWSFLAEDGAPSTALVQGSAPTPLYAAYADFAAGPLGGSASPGVNAAGSPACAFAGDWPEQNLNRRLSRVSRDPTAVATCRFWGTGVDLVSRYSPGAGSALVRVDGATVPGWATEDGWSVVPLRYGLAAVDAEIPLVSDLDPGPHTLEVRLAADGELVFGGIVVTDVAPMVWPVATLLVAGVLALALSLREAVSVLAEHLDLLQRRRGVILQPALPRLDSWRPAAALRGRR